MVNTHLLLDKLIPDKGFVHVLDDTSLEILISTLDTITEFVEYLEKKEEFICSGKLIFAAGEEDLLASYLQHLDDKNKHGFFGTKDFDFISVDEGLWQEFSDSPQRKSQIAANKASYAWDELIETFSKHIFANTEYYTSTPGVKSQEKYLRLLAKEPRTRRRMLIEALFGLIRKTDEREKGVRVVCPSNPNDPHYIFLLLPHLHGIDEDEYREVRRKLLEDYCMVVKLKFPNAEDIVGIATESGMKDYRSEDVAYFDARNWSPEEEAEAKSLQEDLGLLQDTSQVNYKTYEFPLNNSPTLIQQEQKGIEYNGNWPCLCGKPKKYKRCCGQR